MARGRGGTGDGRAPAAGAGLAFEGQDYAPPGLTPAVHVVEDLRPDPLEDQLLWALGAARAAGLPVTARWSALLDQIAYGVPSLAVRTPPPASRLVLRAVQDPQTQRWRLELYPPPARAAVHRGGDEAM